MSSGPSSFRQAQWAGMRSSDVMGNIGEMSYKRDVNSRVATRPCCFGLVEIPIGRCNRLPHPESKKFREYLANRLIIISFFLTSN
jgi:hypothetical protein